MSDLGAAILQSPDGTISVGPHDYRRYRNAKRDLELKLKFTDVPCRSTLKITSHKVQGPGFFCTDGGTFIVTS